MRTLSFFNVIAFTIGEGFFGKMCRVALMAFAVAECLAAEPPPLFVFDNGLSGLTSPTEQAALLKELGYDGICTRPANATPELFAAMDREGLKVRASYIAVPAAKGSHVPPEIAGHIGMLKGRGTLIWLGLTDAKAGDDRAVEAIRKVCDLAAAADLEVALYPHVGFKTSTVRECARLADLADRRNLGLSFTLCHFLAQNDAKELETTLRAFGPRLKLVQINGCDAIPPGKADWKRLIQPLGQGTFDVGRVIRCLDAIGYQGLFNLQCYQIESPAREHLTASMRAWRNLHTKSK